ncbi:glycosyl hydrolase family 5 [Hyphomicrobium sp.]|uniref:glycosyl hydrolase family 5 n=1 Tax=Hyphomicrobium sp. TaxID=82 RepID=UPI002E31CC5F|nr:glycosyl hydrolase family 5 [Hyphomicrobium sp.]HEX2842607.1 glycosyl hydrolase family 5 [Hyphomicrobium sp.]
MRLKPLAIAALIAAGASLAPKMASAATALPVNATHQSTSANAGMLQEVGHRHWHRHRHWNRPFVGRCWKWRNICADRWGWGTWKQQRCLRNHGC